MRKFLRLIISSSFLVPLVVNFPALEYLNCFWTPTVLEDDFSTDQLDLEKWKTDPFWGRVDPKNEEEQYYHDDAFELIDGILRIRADRQSMGGKNFTSGLIESRSHYAITYGCVEVRMRVPKGQGFWTSVWLYPLSNEWPPEIDIVEFLGHKPRHAYLSHHWKDPNGEYETYTESVDGPDFTKDFHTFTINWSPNKIIWYIDGIEHHRTEVGVPDEPMFLLINLAVGGKWPGSPDETTPFPSYLEIDRVRISQPNNTGLIDRIMANLLLDGRRD